MTVNEKFCPVCKNKNEKNAEKCRYCGAALSEDPTEHVATTKNTGGISMIAAKVPPDMVDNDLIPNDGLAVYAPGESRTYYLHVIKELTIGRKVEKSSDTFLDLSELDAYNLGLSRRHVMIRDVDGGYELVDLASTNGTWLNDERLVPDRPYRLVNGSQLRLGRLRLFVIFKSQSA